LFYNIDILEELSIDFRKNTTKMELNCNSIEHCYDITKILFGFGFKNKQNGK
jgi:hypothetical protein